MEFKKIKSRLALITFLGSILFGGISLFFLKFSSDPKDFLPDLKIEFKSIKTENNRKSASIYFRSLNSVFNSTYFKELDSIQKMIEVNYPKSEIWSIRNLSFNSGSLIKDWNDSITVYNYKDVFPKFISKDKRWSAIYVLGENDLSELDLSGFNERVLIADENQFNEYDNWLRDDFMKVLFISILFLLALIYFFLKSIQALLLSLGYFLFCSFITLGCFVLLDKPLNSVTIIVPVVVLVVCIGDLMYYFTNLQKERKDRFNVIKEIKKPITLTTLTTVLGFLSLYTLDFPVLKDFGLLASIGVLVAFLGVLFLVPQFNVNIPDSVFTELKFKESKHFSITLILTMFVIFLFGLINLKVDQKMFQDYNSDSTFSSLLKLQDEQFEGVRELDAFIAFKDDISLEQKLKDLETIESYFEKNLGLLTYDSYRVELMRYQRNLRQGVNILKISNLYYPLDSSVFVGEDKSTFRIRGMINDMGSYKFQNIVSKQKKSSNYQISFQSKSSLLDMVNAEITGSLSKGVVLVILLVGLVVLLFLKSIKLSLISIFVNVLPLITVFGFMGIMDISLNVITASVFTILYGIAVDDTIHFVSVYHKTENIVETLNTTGRAIIRTSIIICVGFGCLLFSDLESIRQIGLLMIIGVIAALFSDLLILPWLLSFQQHKIPF